jgi:hypothetical protein
MPVGLIIMNWDERVGANVKAQYPPEIVIQPATLMQVYSQHEYAGDAGMVSFITGPLNIASYYTGQETMYYIILLMEMEEEADSYEEGLADLSRQVLMNQEGDSYKQIMASLFQRISVYPKLNEEQRLAIIYQTEVKRMIINRLREEAIITKAELLIWLKDVYQQGFFDLESVLLGLIKQDLIKVSSVKGISSEVIFITKDLLISRVPPSDLINDVESRGLPISLKETYKEEVSTFFKEYTTTEADNLKIMSEVILDPQVYETIKLLRVAAVTRDDLEKLKKKGVEDIDFVLKTLWENKIIAVFQDKNGNEYYCMRSDFHIQTFFPDYLIDVLRKAYNAKTQNSAVLVRELELLRDTYLEGQKGKKSKKQKVTKETKEISSPKSSKRAKVEV